VSDCTFESSFIVPANLKALIAKLNSSTRRALESAAGLCLERTHYEVDVEHLFCKLLETPENDLSRIAKHFGIELSTAQRSVAPSLYRFKTGNARTPALSPLLCRLLTDAWLVASLAFSAAQIRLSTLT
jgi:type VI secretion system protein VasG